MPLKTMEVEPNPELHPVDELCEVCHDNPIFYCSEGGWFSTFCFVTGNGQFWFVCEDCALEMEESE